MSGLRHCGVMLILLAISGCVLQQSRDYDQWRDFHSAVNAMSADERRQRYVQLDARHDRLPSTMTKLQLAYLLTLDVARTPEKPVDNRVVELLDGVRDGHELAPIRDLLRQYLQLKALHDKGSRQIGDLRAQCADFSARLTEAANERESLQREIDTCTDQLQALKEIENMMSASDDSLEAEP